MIKFFNKYNQAQTWLELMKVREYQKAPVQVTTPIQTTMSTNILSKPQVVFSKYDLGHNAEEAGKISQLYADLSSAICYSKRKTNGIVTF
ncbi:MAG TPA: hypothetical protein VF810_03520 [Patescibacteria group bacterium]